ncbi:MAG TPA: hypothetical protein VFI31_26675 [Pirellulales bacterium]|nr:hypothetical protein [Pirellulales bacterium]
MYVYLLLIAAGGCWIGGVAGAILWWNARRGVNDGVFAGSAAEDFSSSRERHDELGGCDRASTIASGPDRCQSRHLIAADSEADQKQEPTAGSSLRFPYPQRQWLAACRPDKLPAADDFFPVQCSELFDDGVSFYSDSGCDSQTVVISLGTRKTAVFMLAAVVAQQESTGGAPARYLVECRFIRRVREGTRGWSDALRTMDTCPTDDFIETAPV